MAEWRVTLNRDLPIEDFAWDAGEARGRIFKWATNATGEFNAGKAADAFLIGDPSTGDKGDLRFPVADLRDGRLVISAAALRAARGRFAQNFPKGVPEDVRGRANDLANTLLAEFNNRQDWGHFGYDPRQDVDESTIAVMLSVPPEYAGAFPQADAYPHVTMIFVGSGDEADASIIAEVASEAVEALVEETVKLDGLAYFDQAEQRVAYAVADVSDACRKIRETMDAELRDLGIEVKHYPGAWTPHATLAYLGPGAEYEGEVPCCGWPVEGVEIWRGDERTLIYPDHQDKLAKRGGKWVALSADGTKELGTYDTEAEARERLRQVEAAKAAKDDGIDLDDVRLDARSEEEKAEVRSRWQGEGPNIGPARMKEWLDSPFSGPNRKTGEARARARRVANRALRLMEKSTADWTDADYAGALQVLAFISRMREVKPGEPLVIDGREGPSPQRASLLDWGFDPKKDGDERADGEWTLRKYLAFLKGRVDGGCAESARLLAPLLLSPKTSPWTRKDGSERTEVEKLALEVEFESLVNMTPAEHAKWLDGPFSGPNRNHGGDRALAMRMSDRVARLNEKPIDEWSSSDYDAAAEIVTFIGRELERPQGEPLMVDDAEGPSERDARLMDWGHDVRKDAARSDSAEVRQDAGPQWTWKTQGDDRVRPEHGALNGKTFDLGKKDASEGEPGDAFGCRCFPVVVPRRGTRREAQAIERAETKAKRLALTRWDRKDAGISAPSVHTESRNLIEVRRMDRALLQAPEVLANGWRRYPVAFSKAGNVQRYIEGGREILEFRPKSEIFSRASMDSGIGVPWELRHSKDLLTPDTVRGVARGCVLSVDVHPDGEHTAGHAVAWDRELFDAIDSREARDVSVAFTCKIDPRPGTTDDGQRFDRRQLAPIWNSLASEPRGRAGTARVLSDRLDAADAIVVHSADDLLRFGRGDTVPTVPIYYDLRGWVRHDSAADAASPENTTPKDTPMKMLEMMLAKHGKTAAELAEALGVAEADLATALEDEEMMAKAVEFLMMPMREDMAGKVMVEGMEYEVDPKVAKYVALLEERATTDAGTIKRAQDALTKAENAAQKRADAMADMVSRADAEAMVVASAMEVAEVIELAKRGLGNKFVPEARKDADGADLPISAIDWKRAALRGAYGEEEAAETIKRFDAKPAEIRDALYDDKLVDARRVIDERANTSQQQIQAIARNRAAQKGVPRSDGADPLLSAAAAAQAAASNTHTGADANSGA